MGARASARALLESYLRSTPTGEVVWLAMLISPFVLRLCRRRVARGTPMAARSLTATTSAAAADQVVAQVGVEVHRNGMSA